MTLERESATELAVPDELAEVGEFGKVCPPEASDPCSRIRIDVDE